MKPPACSLLLLILFFVAAAEAREQFSRFDQWDRDRSGSLTVEELPEPLRRNFSRVDRNGDGVISREEDAAVRKRASADGNPRGGQAVPDTVAKLADIDYAGTGNPRQALDLYLPNDREEEAETLPLLVFIHGGGWRKGDKASGWSRIREFVTEGTYAAASIGYRLSDEAQWPAQIHDCKAAIRWLRANAAEYGYDPDRIAVWGTSAGGHLVSMLGMTGGGAELEGTVGEHAGISSEVTCVVNFFGPGELLTMNDHPSRMDHDAPGSPESLLIGGPIQENPDKAKDASPVHWVSEDDEPFLIVHGTKDPLVPYAQSVDLEKRLEEAGVPAILLTVKEGGHGNGFGPTVTETVRTFLAFHLRGIGKEPADAVIVAGE